MNITPEQLALIRRGLHDVWVDENGVALRGDLNLEAVRLIDSILKGEAPKWTPAK